MKSVFTIIIGLILLPVALVAIMLGTTTCGWINSAATVVKQELAPQTLLTRYQWFKDAYARINAYDSNLNAYKDNLAVSSKVYGEPAAWPKDVRNDIAIQRREITGILAMRNNLASEYNANMAKLNYRFTNIGDLPAGATEPLPREVIEYRLQ